MSPVPGNETDIYVFYVAIVISTYGFPCLLVNLVIYDTKMSNINSTLFIKILSTY